MLTLNFSPLEEQYHLLGVVLDFSMPCLSVSDILRDGRKKQIKSQTNKKL